MSKNIVRATGVILIVNLLVKLLGFVRESVIAGGYGASLMTDLYLVAYTIPYFFQAILGTALIAVVVPVITRYLAEDNTKDASYISSLTINVTALILLVITALGMLAAPLLVKMTAPGLSAESIALATRLALIMFPLVFFMGLASTITGVLNSCYRFVAGAVAPGISNVVIILTVLLFGSLGIEMLAVGTLISFVFSVALVIIAYKRTDFKYSFVFNFKHPVIKRMMKDVLPIALGVAVTQVYFFFNRIFASYLPAEGSISALNFANKLMNLPVGIFVAAVAAVIYPALSEAASKKDSLLLPRTVNKGLSMIGLVAIPASVGLIVLRVPLVQLLFERGAFDHDATVMTAYALLFFSVGVLPVALNMVLTRAFYALSDVKTPVIIGVLSVAANILLSLLFMQWFSHGGLALANSVAAFINSLLLYIYLLRRMSSDGAGKLLISLAKMLAASLVMGAAVYFCAVWLAGSFGLLIQTAGSVIVGCVVYFAVAWLLKVEEIRSVPSSMRKIFSKRLTKTQQK